MNKNKIEEANKETKETLGLFLKINGIAFVLIIAAYVVFNILGFW